MKPTRSLIEELDFACHEDKRGTVISLYFFGLKNAEMLTAMSGEDVYDLLREAGTRQSYKTELYKAKKIGLELKRQGIDISSLS